MPNIQEKQLDLADHFDLATKQRKRQETIAGAVTGGVSGLTTGAILAVLQEPNYRRYKQTLKLIPAFALGGAAFGGLASRAGLLPIGRRYSNINVVNPYKPEPEKQLEAESDNVRNLRRMGMIAAIPPAILHGLLMQKGIKSLNAGNAVSLLGGALSAASAVGLGARLAQKLPHSVHTVPFEEFTNAVAASASSDEKLNKVFKLINGRRATAEELSNMRASNPGAPFDKSSSMKPYELGYVLGNTLVKEADQRYIIAPEPSTVPSLGETAGALYGGLTANKSYLAGAAKNRLPKNLTARLIYLLTGSVLGGVGGGVASDYASKPITKLI